MHVLSCELQKKKKKKKNSYEFTLYHKGAFEEVCLFYVIPECFRGRNQIEILLNYALISINKILSQTPYADYIQILQFSSETEFTPLILAPAGMATR